MKARRAVRGYKDPYTVVYKAGLVAEVVGVERSVWTPDATAAGVALARPEGRWGAGGDCKSWAGSGRKTELLRGPRTGAFHKVL